MKLRTCVSPEGRFVYGIHRPSFTTANLRRQDLHGALGLRADGTSIMNDRNFPPADVKTASADRIYEIPNAFPFRGTTFINSAWAAKKAADPSAISLRGPEPCSMTNALRTIAGKEQSGPDIAKAFACLPRPVLICLAGSATDPADLTRLAEMSCELEYNRPGQPVGIRFGATDCPLIKDPELFETLVNNRHLPDAYKEVMVLRPGIQGDSEIVGEYRQGGTHVFEYLRSNSYIPWGHFASNMANDAIRYSTADLDGQDMTGLRHLYYQRTYLRLAEHLGVAALPRRQQLTVDELEKLRIAIFRQIGAAADPPGLPFTATLWGWNYGFAQAPDGYRLHASHQQIHQQYALIPDALVAEHDYDSAARPDLPAYSAGDQIASFCALYREQTGKDFFAAYIAALRDNNRMDGPGPHRSLIVHEDDNAMLFVPKAQVSQWELQIMASKPAGNILETDTAMRASLDRTILLAQKIYARLGARLVSTIEYSKRFDSRDRDQRLLYSFLPKLPYAMGAFSEAQLRWVCGHYPEDFAAVCRNEFAELS